VPIQGLYSFTHGTSRTSQHFITWDFKELGSTQNTSKRACFLTENSPVTATHLKLNCRKRIPKCHARRKAQQEHLQGLDRTVDYRRDEHSRSSLVRDQQRTGSLPWLFNGFVRATPQNLNPFWRLPKQTSSKWRGRTRRLAGAGAKTITLTQQNSVWGGTMNCSAKTFCSRQSAGVIQNQCIFWTSRLLDHFLFKQFCGASTKPAISSWRFIDWYQQINASIPLFLALFCQNNAWTLLHFRSLTEKQ
jgi:hypothetical protein